MNESPKPQNKLLPVELELFIDPDGTVVFADLAAEMIPIAQKLNPDQPLICELPNEVNEKDRKASV